jgi:hypothetical protein
MHPIRVTPPLTFLFTANMTYLLPVLRNARRRIRGTPAETPACNLETACFLIPFVFPANRADFISVTGAERERSAGHGRRNCPPEELSVCFGRNRAEGLVIFHLDV